jgi:hypothetical protein
MRRVPPDASALAGSFKHCPTDTHRHRSLEHARPQRGHLRASIQSADGFSADCDGREKSSVHHRQERHAGEGLPPKNIIATLNASVVRALSDATVRQRLADLGQEVPPGNQQTPEALAAYQKAEIEKWWPIIKAAGIKAE